MISSSIRNHHSLIRWETRMHFSSWIITWQVMNVVRHGCRSLRHLRWKIPELWVALRIAPVMSAISIFLTAFSFFFDTHSWMTQSHHFNRWMGALRCYEFQVWKDLWRGIWKRSYMADVRPCISNILWMIKMWLVPHCEERRRVWGALIFCLQSLDDYLLRPI